MTLTLDNDAATYDDETRDIISRVGGLGTELAEHDFDVLAAFSGLRPSREEGAQVERDAVVVGGVRRPIIHNYSAGGTGYQARYGMAVDAVRLADDVLSDIRGEARARL
jgi:D-amino-acid oxidase